MHLIRVLELLPSIKGDGWDYYEERYDLSSYSDQYSTGWNEVSDEELKELIDAISYLNTYTNKKYAVLEAYNSVSFPDLINMANAYKKAEEKKKKEREAYNKKQEAEKAEKAKARKLKQLEKLKKELEDAGT